MDRRLFLGSVAAGTLGRFYFAPAVSLAADDKMKELNKRAEAGVEKGLEYFKRVQSQDGHFEAPGGQYPTSMTALAGMTFLMEGSTLKEGKYSDQVTKAVNWFLTPNRQQPNGLLGNVNNPTEQTRYMYGHGFGTMFLACAYGEEEDAEQRKKLETVLTKAVDFIAKAQTNKTHRKAEGKEVEVGGWGYVSAAESGGRGGFDEGSVTITQLQALRAARNAGIKVPKETIDKAVAYLEACTTPNGGIIYSYANSGGVAAAGQERPALTAAGVACAFSAGEYKGELAKRWITYCRKNIQFAKGRFAHEEYTTYYFAQAVYVLGDDRYGQMFDKEPKDTWLTWSKFKEALYPYLLDIQNKSTGGWEGSGSYGAGPIFISAAYLTILQLEKGILPLYQR